MATTRKGHKTVNISIIMEVDEKIAPLIQECWRLGFQTLYSCECEEGNGDQAYILFNGTETANNFADLVLLHEPKWHCEIDRIRPSDKYRSRCGFKDIKTATEALRFYRTRAKVSRVLRYLARNNLTRVPEFTVEEE